MVYFSMEMVQALNLSLSANIGLLMVQCVHINAAILTYSARIIAAAHTKTQEVLTKSFTLTKAAILTETAI